MSQQVTAPVQAKPRQRPLVSPGVLALALGIFSLAAIYHYTIYVPQVDQPHRLTLLDDLFAFGIVCLVGLVGLALGRPLLRRFHPSSVSRLEWNALALGMGWGILSLAVLGVGLLHLLYPWFLASLLGAVLAFRWKEVWHVFTALTSAGQYRRLARFLPATPFERTLAALAALEALLLCTQMLTLPYNGPFGYDLYQYHWAIPRLYLLHHAIYAIPGWANADFPFNTEMLNTLALAFASPEAALLLQAIFGVLAMLLLAGYLYRRFGRLAAWLAVALCLATPLFTGLLGSGYAEPAIVFYGVASVLLLLDWLELTAQPNAREFWRLVVLAGLFAGFGLGAKYQEGQICAGAELLLVGAGLVRAWRARQRHERAWPMLRRFALAACIYAGAACLPLLPWLIRNWALLGNPIYPAVWSGLEWDAARSQIWTVTMGNFGPSGSIFWQGLLAFFNLFFTFTPADAPPVLPPGYLLLFALLLPVLLVREWRSSRRQAAPGGVDAQLKPFWSVVPWWVVIGGAYLAWILSGALLARYALVWLILLVVPAAAVLAHLCRPLEHWQVLRSTFQGAILLMLLATGPLFTLQYWIPANPLSLLTGQVSLRQWEQQHIMEPSYWAMVDYVNQQIPRDARVLLLGRGAGYFLEGRDYVADSGEDWIPYLETEGHTAAGMVALLRHDGFRYVIYEETTLQFVIHTFKNTMLARYLPPFRQFLANSLTRVWNFDNFHIYAVPP